MDIHAMPLEKVWQIVEEQAKAHPNKIKAINATFSVSLTGEEEAVYYLFFDNGVLEVSQKEETSVDCALTLSDTNFKKLLQGNLNTTTAFMSGKLKVKGNIGLALKLENALKSFSF